MVPSSKPSREVLGLLLNSQLHMCNPVFLNMFLQIKDYLYQKNEDISQPEKSDIRAEYKRQIPIKAMMK